jgi:hypothetical protein
MEARLRGRSCGGEGWGSSGRVRLIRPFSAGSVNLEAPASLDGMLHPPASLQNRYRRPRLFRAKKNERTKTLRNAPEVGIHERPFKHQDRGEC